MHSFFCHCHNKLPQSQQLKATQIYYLTVLWSRALAAIAGSSELSLVRLRSQCWQGTHLSECSRLDSSKFIQVADRIKFFLFHFRIKIPQFIAGYWSGKSSVLRELTVFLQSQPYYIQFLSYFQLLWYFFPPHLTSARLEKLNRTWLHSEHLDI